MINREAEANLPIPGENLSLQHAQSLILSLGPLPGFSHLTLQVEDFTLGFTVWRMDASRTALG